MGQQGVGELVDLHVGVGMGLHAGLEQGQADGAVIDTVAVLAVVEQGHAVVTLGEVHPLLGAGLKAGLVPGGVGVGLALDIAELDLKGGLVGVDVHGELGLQQVLVELPIHLRLEVDPAGIGVEVDLLDDLAAAAVKDQLQNRLHSAVGDPAQLSEVIHIPGLFGVEHIDVPVVVIDGLVLVAADPGGLAGLQDLAVVFLVENGGEGTRLVEGDGVEGSLQVVVIAAGEGGSGLGLDGLQGLIALGGDALDIGHSAGLGLLDGVDGAVLVAQAGGLHIAQADDVIALEAQGVEDGHGIALACQSGQPLVDPGLDLVGQGLVLGLGHVVDLGDGGAGENVVELVEQDDIPPEPGVGLVGVILVQHAQQLQVHQQLLGAAVALLVPTHGGVGAAVVLKVELALPGFQTAVVLHARIQLVEIGPGRGLADHGDARDTLFHALGGLQHLPGGTAAAVAVAVADQDVVVDLLILVALPAAHDGTGVEHAVVGGEEALLRILVDAGGGNQVGQNLGAVDAPPDEGVVGDAVDLIPGQLGGHEVVDAGLAHDLGQGTGVAKDIGQPQDLVVLAEFLPEEPLAVEELTDQALAGGQIAVGLQPHAAFRLPAALGNALLDLLVELGIALLQEVVEHGLAGHELVVGELLHELEHRGEGADHLLPGLGYGPPPGHVDVGVADAGGDDTVVAAHLLVELLLQICLGLGQGLVESRGVGQAHIQQVDGVIQHGLDVHAGLVVLAHPGECLQGDLQIVVEAVDLLIPDIQVHQEPELPVQGAGVCLNVDLQLLAAHGFRPEPDVAVVHVRTLDDLIVDEDQELGILAVVPLLDLGANVHPDGLAVEALGDGGSGAEPVMGAGQTVEIGLQSGELALKLVGAGVVGVPVHRLAVKGQPGIGAGLGLLGTEKLSELVLPVVQLHLVPEAQIAHLVGDDLNALVDKIHR